MTKNDNKYLTFWQVIITSLITAIVSISVAIINSKNNDKEINDKIEHDRKAFNDSLQKINVRIYQTLISNSQTGNITQHNKNGNNFGRDQNNGK